MARNVVSVDVEDYFHAEAFSDVVDRARWDSYASRVVPNTRRLLQLLATLDPTFAAADRRQDLAGLGLVRELGGQRQLC